MGSVVFCELFAKQCSKDKEIMFNFLNRLLNTLNWTATEMSIAFNDFMDASSGITRLLSKANVLFNLCVNLLRLLEFVALRYPKAFLHKGFKVLYSSLFCNILLNSTFYLIIIDNLIKMMCNDR